MPSRLATPPTTETRSDAPATWPGRRLSGAVRVAAVQTLLRTPLYERHVAAGARHRPLRRLGDARAVRGRRPPSIAPCAPTAASSTSRTWASCTSRARRARELLQGAALERPRRVEVGHAQYTLLTNERGGIIDDLIAYRLDRRAFLLVVNASNREPDFAWLKEREHAARRCATPRTSTRCSPSRGRVRSSGSASRRRRRSRSRWARSTASSAWSPAPATPASAGVELICPERGRGRALGRRRRPRRRPVRARRARHAPARDVLPASRQRHHA